jgi:dTDP-glucose 4,6-dehydratase
MNLLVTGGCGFIGSNVIQQVMGRAEIAALVNLDCLTYAGSLDNVRSVAAHPKYSFEQVDLREEARVFDVLKKHDITHVLHLAAESHVDRSIAGPAPFLHTNVLGTFHLLEACRTAWAGRWVGKRFHHISTDEVYGSAASGAFTENSAYAPSSPYSASKAAADMLVRAYHRTYDFPAVITNCGNNFGPHQHAEKLIPVIIDTVCRRQPIPLYGDGQQVRDWIFVRDHTEALWQVLMRGRAGETYNIGARCERTNRQIAERICDFVDELAPHLGGNSRALISHVADRPGHDRRYAIDPTKIEQELGWKAQVDFDSALRATVEWFLTRRPPGESDSAR